MDEIRKSIMDEENRTTKRNKFGGIKYVYDLSTMKALRSFFESEIQRCHPTAQILYWT
jgi:spore photoproduct lyase